MFGWSALEQRRPALTQTRSSGFIWPPRLVDIQRQRIEAVEAREAPNPRPQRIERKKSLLDDSTSLPLPAQNGGISPISTIASNTLPTDSLGTVGIDRQDSLVSTLTDAAEGWPL